MSLDIELVRASNKKKQISNEYRAKLIRPNDWQNGVTYLYFSNILIQNHSSLFPFFFFV